MRRTMAFVVLLLPVIAIADQAHAPQSAEYCGDCHRAIYDGWKHSAHASAMESRLFQDAMKMADTEFGAEARKVCLHCHSPLAATIGDLALTKKISWEGITCDYCHSIRDVTVTGPNPVAHVEFTGVKSGPYADVVSPAHGTMFSKVHTTSLVCISCHEYRNSLSFPVLTTYSEWRDSSYAKAGKQCQSCHMYAVEGKVVDVRVNVPGGDGINLHQMPGSHSIEQLNKAIRSQMSAVRDGEQLKVTVKLTNAGAGHYVPTGSPMRQLILEVRMDPYDGGQSASEERVYARTITNQKGEVLHREHVSFLRGAKVLKDTRLAPNETRTENFQFSLPSGKRARVEASLYYFYSPMATSEAEQKIRFVTMSRLVQ